MNVTRNMTGEEPRALAEVLMLAQAADADADGDGATEVEDNAEGAQDITPRRGLSRWIPSARFVPIVLALTLASASVMAVVYYSQYRPDQQTDSSVARSAIQAASAGTVAVLSYSPDTLEQDFSAAESHLTGEFLTYYSKFAREIVAPAATQNGVKATASVVRAAVSEIHPSTAVVLVAINQTTVSKDKPDPTFAASSVLVTLSKQDDAWLISRFDPV